MAGAQNKFGVCHRVGANTGDHSELTPADAYVYKACIINLVFHVPVATTWAAVASEYADAGATRTTAFWLFNAQDEPTGRIE